MEDLEEEEGAPFDTPDESPDAGKAAGALGLPLVSPLLLDICEMNQRKQLKNRPQRTQGEKSKVRNRGLAAALVRLSSPF